MKSSPLTFLSTEIEGSRQLWDRYPESMRAALTRHDALVRQAIETYHGAIFRSDDGAIQAAFPVASYAAAAALAGQRSLLSEPWGLIPMRVKMALHCGPAIEKDGDYRGPTLTHLAYLLKAAHGTQILLSDAIRGQLEPDPQPQLRELGAHPLLDLYSTENCYQLIAPGLPADFPPLHTLDHFSHNLPTQGTPFIGRDTEITEVGRILVESNQLTSPATASCRLVTLVGAGGMGKTRLALQTAAILLGGFPDGAWLVEIGALVDPELVPQAIAKVLGICYQTHPDLANDLIDYLRSRQMLLVLDQCDQLQETCIDLADALLRNCPNLKILATSREALEIPGETVFPIPALSLPEHEAARQTKLAPEDYLQADAVALFVERACSAQQDFTLTEQNAPGVAQICQRLDGIPLAIEMTALRVKTQPLESIAVRIENRFRLLTGSPRIPLSRVQILRAIFDWSFDLLSPSERTLLSRLAVFSNGWSQAAAVAVCADSDQLVQNVERRTGAERRVALSPWNGTERRSGSDRRALINVVIPSASIPDLLDHLLEKGLLIQVLSHHQSRYRMLEPIRQLAREKLLGSGEANRMHSHHLNYFASLATEADQRLWTAEQATWFEKIDADLDNIRTALEWAEASPEPEEVETGLRLAGSLWQYWMMLGCWNEASERLERFFARSDATGHTPEMARALNLAGILAAHSTNTTTARQYLQRAQIIGNELGDSLKIAHSLYGLGLAAWMDGDLSGAQQQYKASLALFRKLDHPAGITLALNELGALALRDYDIEQACQYFEESQAICQQMGNLLGEAQASNALGALCRTRGDTAAARGYYQQALAIFRELANWPGIAEALMGLGVLASSSPDAEAALPLARTYLEESLSIYRKLGQKKRVAFLLTRLDEIARAQGDHTAARAFYEEALLVLKALNPSGGIIAALNELGNSSLQESDPHQAASFFQEALTLATETGDKHGIASNLLGLTFVYIQIGKPERLRWAARLIGQAETVQENTEVSPTERKAIDSACGTLQLILGESAFHAALAEGRAMSLGQAVSYGLGKISPS